MRIGSWKFFTKTTIGGKTDPLMMRYVLFRCEAFGIYVHQFLRSDHDRAFHDHPWPFVAIILKGGYWEHHDQTTDGKPVLAYRRPGDVLVRPAEWRHRVQLVHRNPLHDHSEVIHSWSLCIAGRRCRPWGFFVKWFSAGPNLEAVERTTWCPWKRYDTARGVCVDFDIYEGED